MNQFLERPEVYCLDEWDKDIPVQSWCLWSVSFQDGVGDVEEWETGIEEEPEFVRLVGHFETGPEQRKRMGPWVRGPVSAALQH